MPDTMPDIKFSLPGPEIITLSGQAVDKLVRIGDGDAALLYLYILKTRGYGTAAEAAAALGKDAGTITKSMAALSRLGLINYGDQAAAAQDFEPAEPKRYSAAELTRELQTSADFSSLIDELQRSLGRILSPDELERVYNIYDGLRLPSDVILQLVTHCITESRGRGSGRMPSMRSIEKSAYIWEREGIFSLDRAEEYLKAIEYKKGEQAKLKQVLQIGSRELSATETRYIDSWIAMGFGHDTVEIAYDRTIIKTGKLTWSYMDSIINNWHVKNLHTVRDILDKDIRSERNSRGSYASSGVYAANGKNGRPSVEKFGDASPDDIMRMERLLKRIKED